MHEQLRDVLEVINRVFDILDLVVLRSALLGLAGVGAYTLIRGHKLRRRRDHAHGQSDAK